MTVRDAAFWKLCYFPRFGLEVNGMSLTWTAASTSDTPDTDEMIRIAAAFGRTIDKELIEKYRSIERGQANQ
jgi:hypothetical protein